MRHIGVVLSLTGLLTLVASAQLASFPRLTLGPPQHNQKCRGFTVPTATRVPQRDLRRRQLGAPNTCGSFGAGAYAQTIACLDTSAHCVAGFLPNANAYAICSTPGEAEQVTITAAYGNWSSGSSCPASAFCCSDAGYNQPNVTFYVAGGYTVTDFGCGSVQTTSTLVPALGLLNPPGFSASLYELTAAPTSSSTSKSAVGSSTSTSSAPTHTGSGGLSSSTKAAIGGGVGGGVAGALLAGGLFFWWRRRQKNKQPNTHSGPTEVAYEPATSYRQSSYKHPAHSPDSYGQQPTHQQQYQQDPLQQTQAKYESYQQASPPAQWASPKPETSPASNDYHMSATYSPVEGWEPTEREQHELHATTQNQGS